MRCANLIKIDTQYSDNTPKTLKRLEVMSAVIPTPKIFYGLEFFIFFSLLMYNILVVSCKKVFKHRV